MAGQKALVSIDGEIRKWTTKDNIKHRRIQYEPDSSMKSRIHARYSRQNNEWGDARSKKQFCYSTPQKDTIKQSKEPCQSRERSLCVKNCVHELLAHPLPACRCPQCSHTFSFSRSRQCHDTHMINETDIVRW